MVRYSYRSAQALAYLKRYYNDVDIFVEDTSNHNMWLFLVRRLLSAERNLSSVNMLGGRDAVVKACRASQSNDTRPRLYIIDGDFDFLTGKGKPQLKHLYRLRAYCIENILLGEACSIQIALECKPTATEATLASLIDFNARSTFINQTLRPLFVIYATAHLLAPEIRTVSLPLTELITQGPSGPMLDVTKVLRRILRLARQVAAKVGLAVFRSTRAAISARSRSLDTSRAISGKDYILPLFLLHFRAVCGYKLGNESFKVALARSYDISAEPWLARRIRLL